MACCYILSNARARSKCLSYSVCLLVYVVRARFFIVLLLMTSHGLLLYAQRFCARGRSIRGCDPFRMLTKISECAHTIELEGRSALTEGYDDTVYRLYRC